MSKSQQDPSVSFGSNDYFRDKDNMRRVVNNMRQEDRQKRIVGSLLKRNIKKALRKNENPNAFINAAKDLKIDPLAQPGIGEESARATRGYQLDAINMFEKEKESQRKREALQKGLNVNQEQAEQAEATQVTEQSNPYTQSYEARAQSFIAGGFDEPATNLGRMARDAMEKSGGESLDFRKGLDRAIGMVKTPEELAELRKVAQDSGIDDEAFSRQVDQWNKKLNPDQVAKPDWAEDVANDRTFKGQDVSRFIGMTREEARSSLMQERSQGIMRGVKRFGEEYEKKRVMQMLDTQDKQTEKIDTSTQLWETKQTAKGWI